MNRTVVPAPHLRRAGPLLTLASLGTIAFATLLPEPGAATDSHFCLVCGTLGGVSAVLNVILFVPLGLGLVLSGFPAKRALLGMFVLSALIEAAQFSGIPGRSSTISDVVTNGVGGALGFAIGRYALTWLRPSPRIALALSVAWFAIWVAIQATSAFGFSPAMPQSEYYGQIAPRLGNFDQFRGRVVRASIADVTVPDTRFEDSRKVRELLLRGATVTTTIVPSGPTNGIAPIVRVADAGRREIALLAQDGQRFVFEVRTGAGALRLNAPFFASPDLFSAAPPADSGPITDTLRLSAHYAAREVRLNVQTARGSYDRLIPITASLGWTMVLPFRWIIEGTRTERVVSVIWIACLLLPIGYWGAGITQHSSRNVTKFLLASVPITLALLYVGLVAVPEAVGVTASLPGDWLAGLTGILLGGMLRARGSLLGPEKGSTDD